MITGLNLVILMVLVSISIALQMYFNKSFMLKILAITLLFVSSTIIYFTLEGYKGWPSHKHIGKGYLISAFVSGPTETSSGDIYIWVLDDPREKTLFEKIFYYTEQAPRAYWLPYSRETESKLNDAMGKIEQGYLVEIEGDSIENKGKSGAQGQNNESNGTNPVGGGGESSNSVENYDVPKLTIIPPDQIIRK